MKREIANIQIVIAFFTAVLTVSCAKENRFEDPSEAKIYSAEIEATTRTELNEGKTILWQNGDLISIFSGNTSNLCYKLTEGIGTNTGRFEFLKKETEENVENLTSNIAIYPYDKNISIKSDGTIEITLQKTQCYTENGFARGSNPMVAVTPDTESDALSFKNICSLFKISLTGKEIIKTLEFSGNNQEKISGKAELTAIFGENPVVSFTQAADTLITLDCGEGVQLSDSPKEFYIVVPPMTFTKGFKVKATSTKGKSMTMSVSAKTTLKRSMVKASEATDFLGLNNDGYVHFGENTKLERYCLDNFDYNNDGVIDLAEASRVTSISNYGGVESLEGIEYFTNLESLYLPGLDLVQVEGYWGSIKSETEITGTVNLSNNKKLNYIGLTSNKISRIIFPYNNRITSIDVSDNPITSLDLTGLCKLEYLGCSSCILSEIDLSKNTELYDLRISNNSISSIDLSNNSKLTSLDVANNYLSSLNLTNNPALTHVCIDENPLTSLDLSHNHLINDLSFYQNTSIKYLDVSMLHNLNYLICPYNLKYLIMEDGQTIPNLTGLNKYEIITPNTFMVSPETIEIKPKGEPFTINALSVSGCTVFSLPEWLSEESIKADGPDKTICLLATTNNTGKEREGQIVLTNENGICRTVEIKQKPYEQIGERDWTKTDFYHRSLFMHFTATWCVFCPDMVRAADKYKINHTDKIEYVAMHVSSSDLGFEGVNLMAKRFGVRGYPTGIIDCRREVSSSAELIENAVKETEDNYQASTGISLSSSVNGRSLDVSVKVYAKEAEEYRIAVILLEDAIDSFQAAAYDGFIHNGVPQLCLSSTMEGDSFSVNEKDSVIPLHYEGLIPNNCNINNCRILVYIQRKYGNQLVLNTSGYGDWYVDNCLSGGIGTSIPLTLSGDDFSEIGGNENITPGKEINL